MGKKTLDKDTTHDQADIDAKETTLALAKLEPAPAPMGDRGLALRDFDDLQRFCKAMVASGFFKDTRDIAQAVVKVQYGAELGIPPVSAMQGVYIVEGRPALSAGLIASRIKASGRYDYRIELMTDERCVLRFYERGQEVGESDFSIEDAEAAGVAHKPTWKRYSRNMLFSRALSNGARWYCPDVFMGAVYTPEELGDIETVEVPRRPAPAPQSHAPQASPTSRPGHAGPPPASSAPAGASDSEPPPHDDGDEGPPETEAYAETAWEHARNAAAVRAAESELGAKVESVSPPKPISIYAHAKAHGFRDPAKVDELIAAQFGRAFKTLSVDEKKQAAALIAAEGAKLKTQGAAIVRGARGGR